MNEHSQGNGFKGWCWSVGSRYRIQGLTNLLNVAFEVLQIGGKFQSTTKMRGGTRRLYNSNYNMVEGKQIGEGAKEWTRKKKKIGLIVILSNEVEQGTKIWSRNEPATGNGRRERRFAFGLESSEDQGPNFPGRY